MIKLVALDMDDTLFLERDYVLSGFNAVGALIEFKFGPNDFAQLAWAKFLDGRRGDIFNASLREIGIIPEPELVQECVEAYRNHVPTIQFLPDAIEFLTSVHGKVPLALITDGPAQSQFNKIKALNLRNFIPEPIVTDSRGAGWAKPSENAYVELMNAFHLEPHEAIYIGDNPNKDFIAPKNLGWQTLRVRRSLGLHAKINSIYDATNEVPTLSKEDISRLGLKW